MTARRFPPSVILLILTLVMAAAFRFIGLDWDQQQHLHPDERFLTMVATRLSWPPSFSAYLDTSASPLNPHNQGFDFYVYGEFPVIFVKFLSQLVQLSDYAHLPKVGRFVSAFLDFSIVPLLYLISRRLFPSSPVRYWTPFIYATTVLPIQLSHFFAVDTFLTFFSVLAFFWLSLLLTTPPRPQYYLPLSALLGLSLGLSLSAKISAVLVFPTFFLGGFFLLLRYRKFLPTFFAALTIVLFTLLSFRFAYPYLFSSTAFVPASLNPAVIANWDQLKYYSQPNLYYPPSTLWVSFTWLDSLLSQITWGLGLPLAVLVGLSLLLLPFHLRSRPYLILPASLVLSVFIYQLFQFSRPLRYFYPAYPMLALLAGYTLSRLSLSRFASLIVSFLLLLWPAAFMHIYQSPHSRVQASRWIYQHVPPGSTLSCDYWDDCLPLPLSGFSASFTTLEYHLYDRDSSEKWQLLSSQLAQTDYLILSSNRLYGSLSSLPAEYPATQIFYQQLFAGSLGFSRVAQFTSRPTLPFPVPICLSPPWADYGRISGTASVCSSPGLTLVDDYAEETFTVYDHPSVIIFQNTQRLSPSDLLHQLTSS